MSKRIKMIIVTTTITILLTLASVDCSCLTNDITYIGHCSYRIECSNRINNFQLEYQCLGSRNYNTSSEIIIYDAAESFDKTANVDVLQSITTLTVFGNWTETNLPFLQNMLKLKTLNVIHSRIQYITGHPFRSLNLIEIINLSHNFLTEINDVFRFDSQPTRMRTIILSYNNIKDLKRTTFEDLSSLTELDLSYNLISELTDEPFTNLTNLVTLRLNNNMIKDINGALNNNINLKHLYLMYNKIECINEESIARIDHLETFDISRNELSKLEPAVLTRHWLHFDDHSICKILLSNNNIVLVPNTTIEDHNIVRTVRNALKNRVNVELDLSKNSISQIEYNAFQAISHLISLDLSNNRLMTFIVNAEHVQYIMYLNLSNNFLRRLQYESFYLMRNLQNLDLSNNSMDNFPDETLSEGNQLKTVNLTNNYIGNIQSLKLTFHSQGGILDLSYNGLSSLRVPKDEAFGLKELILSSNNISDLYKIQLKTQYHLLRLNVSQNLIQELDENSLQLPRSLNYLDLSSNQIQVIGPSSFFIVARLNTLRLSHNKIKVINYGAFSGLSSLFYLDLSYNEIGYLDSKCLMDLQSLKVLSLRSNHLNYLDHSSWFSHKYDLRVYLDDNNYSCDWLARAITDYDNGYSKMQPAIMKPANGFTIANIPCEQKDNPILENSKYISSDDRLLVMTQKILETLKEQTTLMKKLRK